MRRPSEVAAHLGELLEARVDVRPTAGIADFGLVADVGPAGLPFAVAWRQSASVAVIAGNTRPEVMFETPQDGDFVNPGKGGLMNLDWIQFDP